MSKLLIALVIIFMLVTPFSIMIVSAGPFSRGGVTGCQESMPPPLIDGNRTGDWTINCDVLVEQTTIKLRGNITIDFGGTLRIMNSALVEQNVHENGPFEFVVYNQASLTVEDSTLRSDHLTVFGSGDVFLRQSATRVRGGIQAAGGLFQLSDSTLTVMPDAYDIDPDVNVNISAKAVFVRDSIFQIKGLNAPAGNTTKAPGRGGHARGMLNGHLITNLTFSVLGGSGGRAWDQTFGNGHKAGDGGDAEFELIAEEVKDLKMEVLGGKGGKGGDGAESLNVQNGGNGGDGGQAGDATLTIKTSNFNISSSSLSVVGGVGGHAGDGGKTKGGSGGHGGVGGNGGNTALRIEGIDINMVDTDVEVEGGLGGGPGGFGKDLDDINPGNPGRAGSGGKASFSFTYYDDVDIIGSDISIKGGSGPDGALGWQYGSNGGSGGNASILLFTGGNLTYGPDPEEGMGEISVKGGDGGDGGPYEGGTKEKYMGRAGGAGSAIVDLDVLGTADFDRTIFDLRPGTTGTGRDPQDRERIGHDQLILSAARYNVTDSTSTTPFEGLRNNGLGWLVNTRVEDDVPAYIWPYETSATVKVWWNLDVNLSPMLDNQKAEVTVKDADHPNQPVVTSCLLRGGWDSCRFFLQSETINHQGQFLQNYTVQGLSDDDIEYSPLTFYLTDNKAITLSPSGNFYAPQLNLTYPENGATFTVEDLATGSVEVHGTASEDIRDEPVWIQDVEVSFMNWQTREIASYTASSGVNVTPISSSVSRWSLEWDLSELIGYQPRFPSGAYSLCVRGFDGSVWSDDPDPRRSGTELCINIAIFQTDGKKPVVSIPDTFPSRVTGKIPKDGDYVEVEIDVTIIDNVGATLTYFKFEWDFDMDGNMDWNYYPVEGTHPPRASKVFTRPGIYTARLYATDINGDVSTVDTLILISKEVESEAPPVLVPNYCLESFLVFVLILGFIYLGTIFNEVLKFNLLVKIFVPIHKFYKKEIPKEDSIRRQINDYISNKPGRFFNTVKTELDMRSLLLARELLYLEEKRHAVHKRDGWHIRLISTRKKEPKKKVLKPWQKKVLKALIKRPWQSAEKLAERVGRSEAFVVGQLRRLEKRNLITVRHDDEEEGPLYRARIPGKKKGTYKRKRVRRPPT